VTDTFALKKALYSGKLAGAIIDVWENEPDIDLELMLQTLISTPHVAGYSTDGKVNGTSMVVNSLSRYFNLPLENWYPEKVPLPAIPYISINCDGKSEEDILREAVIHTYKIDNDNARLRLSPGDFEKLRGDYPVRREFTSYTIDLKKGTDQIRQMLMAIGFKIKV
jgi:erythronate-4-phosphate dehydrogenase